MAQIINKVIFKYIVLLLLCFTGSIALVLGIHFFFHNLGHTLESKSANLRAKIDIERYLLEEISHLHIAFFDLSAATSDTQVRQNKVNTLRTKITQSQEHITLLNQGGRFEKQLSNAQQSKISLVYQHDNAKSKPLELDLSAIDTKIQTITRFLALRDQYIAENHPNLQTLVQEIRTCNQRITHDFIAIETQVQEAFLADQNELSILEKQNETQKNYYTLWESLIILLSAVLIVTVIYKILQQIVNLYKELENQLYVDGLTKLKSRAALLKDLKKIQNPSIILLDITMFRTLNELYGVEVGNDVLHAFASVLRSFARNKDFDVYRISGDEFVFLREMPHVNIPECTQFMESFFDMMKHKSLYIPSLEDVVYLDVSAGISFDKLNPLGTADIALNRAKQSHQKYVIYHTELDSIQEIKQGVLWKKKIIHGLENDLFVPFFQPIVDKNQRIVEYEALMRFRQVNGKVSYIAPHEFLDIATKTRHYDQISQMTLLKSLHVSAQKGVSLSLNLNYQDILNEPLHATLAQTIRENALGKKLIFEIVESQNIPDYGIVKRFMETFRALGVRFAIDDFGTGFSNFAHILELSPDFVKIDGSLIKHLDTDKKSYELVKAIVFFSQELGIQTVAEFVHSKEVFDVALELGVDLFQGYYFGAPQENI